MANQYTWQIDAMDVYPSSNGQSNVVFNVHWRVNGNDGAANTSNTGTVYSTQTLSYPAGASFTPYANLTSNTVVTWTQQAMGTNAVNAIYSSIDSQIAQKQNPPMITPALPWNN
jgi:hypothetical protein